MVLVRAQHSRGLRDRFGSLDEAGVERLRWAGGGSGRRRRGRRYRCVPLPGLRALRWHAEPDIVYYGESVPKDIVTQAYGLVEQSDALLIAGSSLTVLSGYRFVRQALGIRVTIVNRGSARGDDLATVKVDGGCSELLVLLSDELAPLAVR